ncbi:hypothetical protein L596_014018 [Steinernema carpocapsae]|uniref:Uncharacterized protein n=1 Tax=Steinernema carpocapsae TaxID=34508 RepID=A0A4U5NA48_STECR|nr:hypothetical protein L596_014018 [Steinernema carpocapsae]
MWTVPVCKRELQNWFPIETVDKKGAWGVSGCVRPKTAISTMYNDASFFSNFQRFYFNCSTSKFEHCFLEWSRAFNCYFSSLMLVFDLASTILLFSFAISRFLAKNRTSELSFSSRTSFQICFTTPKSLFSSAPKYYRLRATAFYTRFLLIDRVKCDDYERSREASCCQRPRRHR